MQLHLKTILNFKEKHEDFVYRDVRLEADRIEVTIEPRKRSLAKCSICGERCSGYDKLPLREFIHVPIWGLSVIFLYCMRRVSCKTCGIVAEQVPWSSGKSPITIGYAWFLSEWAKLLSVQEVARQFKTSWHHVFSGVVKIVRKLRLEIFSIGLVTNAVSSSSLSAATCGSLI